MSLLREVFSLGAPARLSELAAVRTLREVWVQQYFTDTEGRVRWRDPKDCPPGAKRLVSPYDTEVRFSKKRDTKWDGFKAHFTETCEPDFPNLLTHVATTAATVPDDHMAGAVHTALAGTGRLPGEHWVDTGYINAAALAAARRDHGVALHGPAQPDTTAQGKHGAYGQDAFTVDWDKQQVTCPHGQTSTQWNHRKSQQQLPVIRVRFSPADCRPCPALRDCVSSPAAERREITLRHRDAHQAMHEARALQQTDAWKDRYKIRAGIEGTISQNVTAFGLRRSRYRGLGKTSLQHQLTGAAINLARIDA